MKRLYVMLSLILIFMLTLSACGGGSTPAEQPAPKEEPAAEEPAAEEPAAEEPAAEEPAEEAPGEVVEIEFWHAMGGELGELVDELAARFNDSQS